MTTLSNPSLIVDLAEQVSGSVLEPGDAGYDAARAVHNGLIDKPALIVRCRTTTTSSPRSRSPATAGSRSRSAAAATTSPAAPSPTAA